MSNIKLVTFSNANDNGDNVIERLEESLAIAKSGGVINCIIVMALSDGSVMDSWANKDKPFVMIGALESIKRDFMDAVIEKR